MNGIWILLLLVFIAALPAILVFFWFRAKKSRVGFSWFLISLAAGIISMLAASLAQFFFPYHGVGGEGKLSFVFLDIFVKIALIEEASRFVTLIPLIKISNRKADADEAFGAATGLAAGLGFAMLENAIYGTSDLNLTLLRAFTAAPVHGACGIRAGKAVSIFSRHPVKALGFFISAVVIHWAYNLMIISPVFPSVLAIPIAFSAFFTSLSLTKPD